MVENGYFKIGEYFYHKNGEKAMLVNNKGILNYNGVEESMHEIAAKMMNGSRRVNAFDFLYVERDGKLVSIDEVRQSYRNTLSQESD